MPKVKVKCESCGKEIERYPSQVRRHVVCSDCWYKPPNIVKCDFCQKEFVRKKSTIKSRHVFCCNSHASLYRHATGKLDNMISRNKRRGRCGKYTEIHAWRAYKQIEKRIITRPKYEKKRRQIIKVKVIKTDTEKSAWRTWKLLELHTGLRNYSDRSGLIVKLQMVPNKTCYLKEARAMLEGKDTWGRNKCTKLIGDDE